METLLSPALHQTAFPIGEPGQIAAARRAGNELALSLGFDETMAGRAALVITEAATNIAKHALRGEILLRAVRGEADWGIEILAIDAGPGMSDPVRNMEDGRTTAGSYGEGLGAMRRLAAEFDVYSVEGGGTVLCLLLWSKPALAHPPRNCDAVCVPLLGESECGDAWVVVESAGQVTAMVADGLGHGPAAALASRAAVVALERTLERNPLAVPEVLMQDAHAALHATRGAAVAIAQVNLRAQQLRFAGVGNIAAAVHGGDSSSARNAVSHAGIVGSNVRKLQEFILPWSADSLLIMHSDGIGTRWDLDRYPGLAALHPGLIAATLYRDFARPRDDATVLVLRTG